MLFQIPMDDVKSAILAERCVKKCYVRAPLMMLKVHFWLRGVWKVLFQSPMDDVKRAILTERV